MVNASIIKKTFLIVLEGIDGCGKTTLAEYLNSRIRDTVIQKFPDNKTKLGQFLYSHLRNKDGVRVDSEPALHLLFSANRYERQSFIENTLKEKSIICDRYRMSGLVYSMAKGLDKEWCQSADKNLNNPHFTFFIDLTPEKALERRLNRTDKDIYEDNPQLQQSAYKNYKELCGLMGVYTIDGNRSTREMGEEIIGIIRKCGGDCAIELNDDAEVSKVGEPNEADSNVEVSEISEPNEVNGEEKAEYIVDEAESEETETTNDEYDGDEENDENSSDDLKKSTSDDIKFESKDHKAPNEEAAAGSKKSAN